MPCKAAYICCETLNVSFSFFSGPLASIQVPDTTNFNMNDLVDQFKSLAAYAGFDNNYIDSAVQNICSTEKEMKGDITEYINTQ